MGCYYGMGASLQRSIWWPGGGLGSPAAVRRPPRCPRGAEGCGDRRRPPGAGRWPEGKEGRWNGGQQGHASPRPPAGRYLLYHGVIRFQELLQHRAQLGGRHVGKRALQDKADVMKPSVTRSGEC